MKAEKYSAFIMESKTLKTVHVSAFFKQSRFLFCPRSPFDPNPVRDAMFSLVKLKVKLQIRFSSEVKFSSIIVSLFQFILKRMLRPLLKTASLRQF